MNYTPVATTDTTTPPPPPPPHTCHKVYDVVHTSSMKGQTLLGQPEIVVGALAGLDVSAGGTATVRDRRWLYAQGLEEPSGMMERLLRRCRVQNQLLRECMAECLGVYVMIVSLDLSFAICVCFNSCCYVEYLIKVVVNDWMCSRLTVLNMNTC